MSIVQRCAVRVKYIMDFKNVGLKNFISIIRLNDKKKTKYEMHRLLTTSQRHESTAAERGCEDGTLCTSLVIRSTYSTAHNTRVLDILG